jgi:hypothetical protein
MYRLFNGMAAILALTTAAFAAGDVQDSSYVTSLPVFAQTKPAVDGVNQKLQLDGGASQGATAAFGMPNSRNKWVGLGGGVGTITVPIGHAFGAQLDLGAGAISNRPVGDASGHLFWRDPDKGMVGVYGSGLLYGNKTGRSVWTVGSEFEAYIGNFTGRALLGVQGSSSPAPWLNPFTQQRYGHATFTRADYFHDIIEATFYPLDDLALTVGHVYSFDRHAVTGEAEWLLPQFRGGNIAPSIFARAAYGWNDSSNVMAGVRIYFGNHDKTLIRRHREDDPVVWAKKSSIPHCKTYQCKLAERRTFMEQLMAQQSYNLERETYPPLFALGYWD